MTTECAALAPKEWFVKRKVANASRWRNVPAYTKTVNLFTVYLFRKCIKYIIWGMNVCCLDFFQGTVVLAGNSIQKDPCLKCTCISGQLKCSQYCAVSSCVDSSQKLEYDEDGCCYCTGMGSVSPLNFSFLLHGVY